MHTTNQWQNRISAPQEVTDLLAETVDGFRGRLGERLVGVYLHGSLAMGCFNPAASDVDALVIVKGPVPTVQREDIARFMLGLVPKAPPKGFGLSVVQERYLKAFEHPTPYEFCFSNGHAEAYRAGTYDFSEAETDADLAANFILARERGVCLWGAPVREVFGAVPNAYFLPSIACTCEWSLNNVRNGDASGMCRVPTYAVLNFCRTPAFVWDGLFLSKAEGGRWALDNLPAEYHKLIQEALREYAETGSSDEVDAETLQRFAEYSWSTLLAALKA